MKFTHCLFLLAFLLCLFATAQAQYKFTINGYINNNVAPKDKNNIKDGSKVTLNFINTKRVDTIVVKNNRFKFTSVVAIPSIAMLEYEGGGNFILIDSSVYNFYLTEVKIDSIHRTYEGKIETSSVFFNGWKNILGPRAELSGERTALANKMANTENKDSLLFYKNQIANINTKISALYIKLAIADHYSYLTAYMLPASPDFSYNNYIGMYNSFTDSVKNSFYGKNFLGRLMASKNLATTDNKQDSKVTGSTLPVITALDTLYKSVVLNSTFFKKSKYTLIEFWASWCAPCRAANKKLKGMTAELANKKIAVVGFSLDGASEPWKEAIVKDKAVGLQISDFKETDSPIVQALHIESIPFNVIVDQDGKIVKKNVYDKDLQDFLASVK